MERRLRHLNRWVVCAVVIGLAVSVAAWAADPAAESSGDNSPATTGKPSKEASDAAGPAAGVVWTKRIGTDTKDGADKIAVDAEGNVFVAGSTMAIVAGEKNYGNYDVYLIKYDSSGKLLWAQQWGTDKSDGPSGLAADGKGGCYVLTTPSPLRRMFGDAGPVELRRVGPDGTVQWTRELGRSTKDEGMAAAVDDKGWVFVACLTTKSSYGSSGPCINVAVKKFSAAGDEQWSTTFGGKKVETPKDIVPDGRGGCVIVGVTTSGLARPPAGRRDLFLVALDSEGGERWRRQFGSEGSLEEVWDMARDSKGRYLVAWGNDAFAKDPGTEGMYVAVFGGDGKQAETLTISTSYDDDRFYLAPLRDGGFVIASTTCAGSWKDKVYLTGYDSSGSSQWTTSLEGEGYIAVRGIAERQDRSLAIAGHVVGAGFLPPKIGEQDGFVVVCQPMTTTGSSAAPPSPEKP